MALYLSTRASPQGAIVLWYLLHAESYHFHSGAPLGRGFSGFSIKCM